MHGHPFPTRFCLLAIAALVLIASGAVAGHFDVYILTGQSNSLGTTTLESPVRSRHGPR